MIHDVTRALGLSETEAEQLATELGTIDGLVVQTPGERFTYRLQGSPWPAAMEKLRGRYTGTRQALPWQEAPILIAASLDGLVRALLSASELREPDAIAWCAACAIHCAEGHAVADKLASVVILHGPLITRTHLRHRPR
jgi:hypothetical protein